MAFTFKGKRYESVMKPVFAEIFTGEREIAKLRGMPLGSAVDIAEMTSTESMFVEAYWAIKRAGPTIPFADLVNEEFESIQQIAPAESADDSDNEPAMVPDPLDGGTQTEAPA